MRIRRVTLENLNSLRGEHSVDFTADPIAGAGLFAITGPTGAGKSTLLDAITLALYGRAARYGKEPNPEDMMSRHTGECRAEVEFEVGGKAYRAAWHLHRARGAAGGKVQPPKRFVYGAGGEVLTQKIKEADAEIESICGLDYERFMRSVLLAQGEFARFLKSDPNGRAELLERLTGTGVYSELSRLAYEEFARRERGLAEQERDLGLLQPLAENERAAAEKAAGESAAALAAARAGQKSRLAALAEGDALAAALAEHAKLLARENALAARRETSAATLASLARHRAAAPFLPALENLHTAAKRAAQLEVARAAAVGAAEAATRAHRQALAASLATGRKLIAAAEKRLDRGRDAAAKADRARAAAQRWLAEHAGDAVLKDLLAELLVAVATLTNARKARDASAATLAKHRLELERAETVQATAARALEKAKGGSDAAAKAKAAADARLDKLEAGRTVAERRAELEALARLRLLTSELEKARRASDETRRALAEDRAKLPGTKAAAEAAERGLAAVDMRLETLAKHLADARLYANLEQQRATLASGEPCPLCGALEHPYCGDAETPTAPSAIERELATAKVERANAAADRERHRKALTELETHIASAVRALDQAGQRIARDERDIEVLRGEVLLDGEAADPREIERKRRAEIEAIEAAQANAQAAVRAGLEAKGALEKCAAEARASAENARGLRARIDGESDKLAECDKELELAATALAGRLSKCAQEPPAAGEEAALRQRLLERVDEHKSREKQLADAAAALGEAQSEEREAGKQLADLRERVAALGDTLGEEGRTDPGELKFADLQSAAEAVRERDLAANKLAATADERTRNAEEAKAAGAAQLETLQAALRDSAFDTPEALSEAKLDPGAVGQAAQLERALSDEAQQLKGALASQDERIAELRSRSPAQGEALATLRAAAAEAEDAIELLTAGLADRQAALRADDDRRAKHGAATRALAGERESVKVWQRLAALIGSHDGRKFRVYAQGLSLDLLLRHANRHLARLSERYLLSRSASEELGLEIVDLFQASAVRPMASLSGGESFLASLALALGLSDLAGRNVQIDSLFIDEGFGSLDTETLDTALSALESLRLQDKTVGVISHVELLKERIGVQICVERKADGTSGLKVISG